MQAPTNSIDLPMDLVEYLIIRDFNVDPVRIKFNLFPSVREDRIPYAIAEVNRALNRFYYSE